VERMRFDPAACRACKVRSACTWANEAPRQRTVRPQAPQVARQAARQRQETAECKAPYALRAGVESPWSQGVRRFDLRRSHYIGLARTHVQQTLHATAMNHEYGTGDRVAQGQELRCTKQEGGTPIRRFLSRGKTSP
jgi:transposase